MKVVCSAGIFSLLLSLSSAISAQNMPAHMRIDATVPDLRRRPASCTWEACRPLDIALKSTASTLPMTANRGFR